MTDNKYSGIITHIIAGAVGAGLVLGAQTLMQPSGDSAAAQAKFGADVSAYLKSNPDAVVAAIKQYQANEEKKQLDEAKQFVKDNSAAFYNDPNSPLVGNPNGDVTLVEFFDYNCHYCRGVASDVAKLQAEDPKLRIVHKHLPILGPSSIEATKVALAVRMQNPTAYETITKTFMTHDGPLTSADIEKAARDTGVDWNRVLVDKETDIIKNEIKSDYDLAQKLGLSGTPGFIVGDNLLPGAQNEAQLKDAVNAARSAGWKSPVVTTVPTADKTADKPSAPATAAPIVPAAPAPDAKTE